MMAIRTGKPGSLNLRQAIEHIMKLTTNDSSVEFSNEDEILFSIRWDDIQRVSAHRRRDFEDEDYYVSVEIVPNLHTELAPWVIDYYPSEDLRPDSEWDFETEWELWTKALRHYVPGFTVAAALAVLDLPEDSDDDSLNLFARELEFDGEESQRSDPELDEWLDRTYDAHADAFTRDDLSEETTQVFVTTYNLLAEVQNGGFEQYFGNSTGDQLPSLRDSLRKIKASSAAETVDRACSMFPRGTPAKRQTTRIRQLESMSVQRRAALDELSDQLTELADETTRCLRSFMHPA